MNLTSVKEFVATTVAGGVRMVLDAEGLAMWSRIAATLQLTVTQRADIALALADLQVTAS